jgi:cob(I)alamin adenosyltransferase
MKQRQKRKGLTLVHTGEGKGKSSSAFGMVFRAAGWGMKVLVIQFIKGQWKTGEQQAASRFDNIEWHAMGDGFTWDTKNPQQDQQTSREIWSFCQQKILTEEYDLVVLDEINYCCSYGWLSGKEIADFIKHSPWAFCPSGRSLPVDKRLLSECPCFLESGRVLPSVILKHDPCPGSDSTSIVPPCCSMI